MVSIVIRYKPVDLCVRVTPFGTSTLNPKP